MTDADYEFLRTLLKARSGLYLSPGRRYLAEHRLQPVAEEAGLDLPAFIARLRSGDEAAATAAMEGMATHESSFFRDRTVFEQFVNTMVPQLIDGGRPERHFRIWSAAAAAGQEPYSLAMLLHGMQERLAGWQVDVLASDLSAKVLSRAESGSFRQAEIERGLPEKFRQRYFTKGEGGWSIAQELRDMVRFQQQNLVEDFGHIGLFDIVFCRNVLIYFDQDLKEQVLRQIARVMRPNAFLVLGAAEAITGLPRCLCRVDGGWSVYRRVGQDMLNNAVALD